MVFDADCGMQVDAGSRLKQQMAPWCWAAARGRSYSYDVEVNNTKVRVCRSKTVLERLVMAHGRNLHCRLIVE